MSIAIARARKVAGVAENFASLGELPAGAGAGDSSLACELRSDGRCRAMHLSCPDHLRIARAVCFINIMFDSILSMCYAPVRICIVSDISFSHTVTSVHVPSLPGVPGRVHQSRVTLRTERARVARDKQEHGDGQESKDAEHSGLTIKPTRDRRAPASPATRS